MRTDLRRTLTGMVAAAAVLTGCSRATTIRSDLVLGGHGQARIDLHQETQAIELLNDSDSTVRIKVLDKKERVVSNMILNAHDQARLDIVPARAVHFENQGAGQAVLHWTLRNDSRIEYTLALQP